MPEFTIPLEISFLVWCSHCGEGLCFKSEGLSAGVEKKVKEVDVYGLGVLVGFCPKCRAKFIQEGVEIGMSIKKKLTKKEMKSMECPTG